MKYILILLLIILITYVGHGLSKYYTDRQHFFSEFTQFLQSILSNISFEKDKLSQIIRRFKLNTKDKCLETILDQYEKYIVKGQSFKIECKILKDEEIDKVEAILFRLGKTDFQTEINNLETAILQIKTYSDNAVEESKKYGSFYTKIALLLGLALAILLI